MVTNKSWSYLDPDKIVIKKMFPINYVSHITLNGDMTQFAIHQLHEDDLHFKTQEGMLFGDALRITNSEIKITQVKELELTSMVVRSKKSKGLTMTLSKPLGELLKSAEMDKMAAIGDEEEEEEDEVEKRIDVHDGMPYTQEEFFAEYGNHEAWDHSQVFVEHRLDPNTFEPFDKAGFQEYYGGLDEWKAAESTKEAAFLQFYQGVLPGAAPMHWDGGGAGAQVHPDFHNQRLAQQNLAQVISDRQEYGQEMVPGEGAGMEQKYADDGGMVPGEGGDEQRLNHYRGILHQLYSQYNPEKLSAIDQLLEAHAGEEDFLIAKIRKKYEVPDDQ